MNCLYTPTHTKHSTYGACYGKQCQDGPDVTAFSEDWVADNFSTLHERDPTRACQMQLLSSAEIEAAAALHIRNQNS